MPKSRERTTDKEQYYTKASVVDLCVQAMKPYIKDNNILIEPAGGTGEFIEGYYRAGFINDFEAYDIEPKYPGITKADFLTMQFPMGKRYVAITNPPFGRMSSLSVKFFNHLAPVCDYIGFIVPKSWRKWTTQNKLDSHFYLVKDINLPLEAFYSPQGEAYTGGKLQTIFQIWEYRKDERPKIKIEDRGYFTKVKPEEADVAFTAFGRGCGRVERTFDRVPNTTKLFLKAGPEVIDALEKIDVTQFTQNVAYTEVVSMEELRYLLNEYFDAKE